LHSNSMTSSFEFANIYVILRIFYMLISI
jgi:hypothetical protein